VLAAAPAAAAQIVEGQQFSDTVGSFVESCPKDPETGFFLCGDLNPTATIDWGDSTPASAGTVTKRPVNGKPCIGNFASCTFDVSGSHTYAFFGTYSGTVDWSDSGGPIGHNSGSFGFSESVADAPISVSNASVTRSGNDATLTATLTDDNPDANACGYDVEINWEDGPSSQPVPGRIEECQLQSRDRAKSSRRRHHARRHRHRHRHRTRAHIATVTTISFTVTGQHTYSSPTEPANGDAVLTVTDASGGQQAQAQVPVATPPQTATGNATNISPTSATLNGIVNSNGGTIEKCEFDWGKTTGYGQSVPCGSIAPNGATSAQLANLTPNTTYHFEVVLTTDIGTSTGGDQFFTTLPPVGAGAPTVTTGIANPDTLTATSAELQGDVNPNGQTLSDCHFEWGTTSAYGHSAPCVPANLSGSSSLPVAASISGLSPDTTYHFRLVAANAGTAASHGADATFTTLPLCNVTAKFGYVNASGCLSKSGNHYVSTAGSAVQLDGLTLTPDHPFITITMTPGTGVVTASGPVTVTAGTVVLADSKFTWTEPSPNNASSVKIASLTPPFGTKVAGVSLQGDLSLSFNKQDGADLTGNAALPFGSLASALGVNGQIVLHTAAGKGLLTDQLQITASNFQLLGVGVKNLKVAYDPTADSWSGSADVSLPTPNKLDIAASLAFQHGSFQKFSGSVNNINFPIFAGVDLQRISVVFGVNPTTIGGGLGLSFGPSVDGKQLARVDGDFLYQAATSTAAGFIDINGSLTLASFTVASGYFDYYTTGLIKFGGQLAVGLPDTSSSNPSQEPVYVSAQLDGALYESKFDIDVKANVALNFIDLNVGADLLISDKGLVACAELSAFGFSWNPGVGYTWATGALDLMADGCSVGPYETLNLGQARDATATRGLAIRPGRSLLELKGTTAQPLVTLSGPHGRHVSVPVGDLKPYMVPGFMVLQDPADKITWIAIQHGGGRWQVTPEPGGSAISSISDAPLLPNPRVHGSVVRKHRRWTFKWHLRRIAGQRVVFWEKGADVAKIIGSTSASRGSLRFVPAPGNRRRRTIEAQVISFGKPRADITVTHYLAPPAPKPGRPRHLKVSRLRGAVRVSWKAAPNTQTYRVEVDTNGVRLVRFVGRQVRKIVIRDVVPITRATVKVSGELADGVTGPAVKKRFHARR
jgi:hypothetical protein